MSVKLTPGIGLDMIEIDRIEQSVERYGDQFIHRIFTPAEINYCFAKANPYPSLAARFAVKEAFAKATGWGIGKKLSWQDIEVKKALRGKPELQLSPMIMTELSDFDCMVSITHTHTMAAAIVQIQLKITN